MSSTKDSAVIGSSSPSVALYKGLKVDVYTVDKPEISLTRQDLVELVNVCIISLFITYHTQLFCTCERNCIVRERLVALVDIKLRSSSSYIRLKTAVVSNLTQFGNCEIPRVQTEVHIILLYFILFPTI